MGMDGNTCQKQLDVLNNALKQDSIGETSKQSSMVHINHTFRPYRDLSVSSSSSNMHTLRSANVNF